MSFVARPMLLVRAGNLGCALPLESISETMRPLPVEPLSEMPLLVQGLAIVRGAPTPVVDLSLLLRGEASSLNTRWVLLRVGESPVALAVEAVLGIRVLQAADLVEVPPLLSKAHPELIQGLGALDRDLLLVLESAHLLPDLPALEVKWDTHAHG